MNHQITGDEIRVKNFYRLKENSLDMVLIGASTTFTNYSAPLAWHEFGVTSYSLGTNSAPMGIAKSMLIEVKKTQKPKVIVIDINGILYDDENESKEGSLRFWIDNMKWSKNKIDTINYLIPSKEQINYYIPLLKYHSNWVKLPSCLYFTYRNFKDGMVPENLSVNGMTGNAYIEPRTNIKDINTHQEIGQMYQKSGQHLINLLEYCKENKIENVVFTNMCRYYSKDMIQQRKVINAAKKVIIEYGFTCYDYDEYINEIGIDPLKDFYNENHLNIYGQEKFTKYFINDLMKKYELKNDHDEDVIETWNNEYKSYKKLYGWADKEIKNGKNTRYYFRNIPEIIE